MDIKTIPHIGEKVKIETKDIFGDSIYTEGTISSAPYQHGFDYETGSWGLYDLSGKGYKCNPCFKIQFKPKNKRKLTILKLRDIVSFEA